MTEESRLEEPASESYRLKGPVPGSPLLEENDPPVEICPCDKIK